MIELSTSQISRILDRNATALILTRTLRAGPHEVEDQSVNRRNRENRKMGRSDLQAEPHAFMVEVFTITESTLGDLNYQTVRKAGFRTPREFYDAWLDWRGCIEPKRPVFIATFQIIEDARWLHRKLHRGYTRNPAQALRGELQALDAADLERYAHIARQNDEARRELFRVDTPLDERVRILERRARDGDSEAQRSLFVIRQRLDAADRRRSRNAA